MIELNYTFLTNNTTEIKTDKIPKARKGYSWILAKFYMSIGVLLSTEEMSFSIVKNYTTATIIRDYKANPKTLIYTESINDPEPKATDILFRLNEIKNLNHNIGRNPQTLGIVLSTVANHSSVATGITFKLFIYQKRQTIIEQDPNSITRNSRHL